MATIPAGWSKTRVLITGPSESNKFTVRLQAPIHRVAFVTAISMQGASAILLLEGFNTNQLATIDGDGNHFNFNYCASNLNGELQFSLFTPPVLPSNPQTSKDITQISVQLVDPKGSPFSVSGVVSVELDFWSYTRPAGTSTML